MSSWFYVKDGERQGPLNRAQLDTLVAEGVVGSATLVWRVGLSEWKAAGTIPELGLPPPPPAPALPPPLPDGEEVLGEQDDEAAAEPVPTWRAGRSGSFYDRVAPSLGGGARAAAPDYAGFWVRGAAKAIDLSILLGFSLIVQQSVALLWFDGVIPLMLENWELWTRFAGIVAPINVLTAITYSVYFILRYEATPGKRMLGLRVVRADGSRVRAPRVVGRYFAEQLSGLIFFAGYVMAAFDDEKRTLHDVFCGTRVVRGPRVTNDD